MVYSITSNNVIEITKKSENEKVWKQFLLSFIASLPFFSHGIQSTVLTSSAHAGHFIGSSDDIPWSTTALILGSIISAPIFCYIADKYGRRVGIYIANLFQGASCIPLLLPSNEVNVITLHALAGISSGGLFTVMPFYIREISTMKVRGLTMSLTILMTSLGYLMKLSMNSEKIMFMIVGSVIVQFILMFCLLESPSYFVKIGKIEEAKVTIGKLTCLPKDHQVVIATTMGLQDERDRARSKGRLTLFRILRDQIWRDGIKIGIVLNTVTMLGGSIVFLDQEKVLEQLGMKADPDTMLVLVCIFAGSLFSVVLIKFLERKYLLCLGYSIIVLSMGTLAVYTQADLTVNSLRWLPVVSLAFLVFGHGVTWGLPTIVMAEMINMEIRSTILGILYTYSQIIKLAHVHTFQYIEDYMGRYCVFYIFACINLFGAVYALFGIPDVKDRSVRQIDRQLKRVPLIKL